MRAFLFLFLLPLTCFGNLSPKGEVHSITLAIGEPRSKKDRDSGKKIEAPFSVWIPEGDTPLKGLIMNPFYEPAVNQKHWQAAAAHWGFGMLGANLAKVKATELGNMTEKGLAALAEKSGRPELKTIKLCLVGMSAGGGMSTRIAEHLPNRVLAAAPVCLEVGPRDEASRKIPMITIFGEKDGRQMKQLLEKLPPARELGAKWGIAVQWGRRHEFGQANNLILPFFDAIINNEIDPAYGDVTNWKPADKGLAWLPNAKVAAVWEAFVEKDRKVKIRQPLGLGDKQEFVIHQAGESITVEITSKIEGSIKIYNGNTLLGENSPMQIPKLSAGIHSIIAVVTDASGKQWRSRPHTIIVR